MKKLLALFVVLLLVANVGIAETQKKIGIIQYVQHNALDESREGFIKALADNGFEDGKNIIIDVQNAQGDGSNLTSIADRFVANKQDLVLAIATPAAQTMAGTSQTIPIIATAITDFVAARLVDSNEEPGGNLSGSSDLNPVADQIKLLAKLAPEAKTIGIIYTSNEDNSILQANIAKEEIKNLGLNFEEITVTNSNEVSQNFTQLIQKVDAVYVPTDNIVASAMPIIFDIATQAKKAVVCGEANAVMSGGLATLGISYFDIGYQAGLMAVDVLNGGDISKMPVRFASEFKTVINKHFIEASGISIPEEFSQFIVDNAN